MIGSILVNDDLAAYRAMWRTVFIQEQGVSEADEIDSLDSAFLHMPAVQDGLALRTARIDIAGGLAKIGRVCVLKSNRGLGLCALLIREAVTVSKGKVKQAKLGSQVHALGIYEALGFDAIGAIYDNTGIDHRNMIQGL